MNRNDNVSTATETRRTSVITPALPPITINEHKNTLEELRERFGRHFLIEDPRKGPGLSSQTVIEWQIVNGKNILPAPKKPPLIISYLRQMANLFSFVLLICGALSILTFIIDTSLWINFYTGLIFWGVAFFNAGLEFWQVYSSAKTLESFMSLVPSSALVMRDGRLEEIPSSELVVGDILLLKTGNKIPVDARIIWSDNVRVDNSSLTGESEPQERNSDPSQLEVLEATNLLFSGTIMISGEAVALVIRIGPNTVIGRLAQFSISEPKLTSRLENEISIFIRRLVLCAFSFGILALILGFSLGLFITDVLDATIGIFVSFLPQGLPATITILLTSAAKRMAKRNVLVKELRSVETLGAMTLLATDKTGTLTQNKMSIVGGWIQGRIYNNIEEMDGHQDRIRKMMEMLTLCTACKLDPSEANKDISERKIFGDATEVGIIQYSGKFIQLDEFFEANTKVMEIPFNSTNKWHLSIVDIRSLGKRVVIMKGAPERILDYCSTFVNENEEIKQMAEEFKIIFKRHYQYFAANGLRILAVGRLELDDFKYPPEYSFLKDPFNFPINELSFMGFVCLRDPPKPGVSWAIKRLQEAGIIVIMITGDHPFTAEAIGRQVGIMSSSEVFHRPPTSSEVESRPNVSAAVIHGEDIDSMTHGDWVRMTQMKELIFARTAPRHKLEIVKQFQSAGHIVGVSGDGVNDSPALRKANLGISMNKTASDVSKDAAHLILLDDNFVSIVAGVCEGRHIFENLKKSIRYTLTHITAEVSALLICALLVIPPPLSPILLIFIDVFAELGPAVSFAGEPPEYDLMVLKPRQKVMTTVPFERNLGLRLGKLKVPRFLHIFIIRISKPFHLKTTGESLIDTDLVLWSFLQGGVIVALGAWGSYILTLVFEKVPLYILYRSALVYFSDNSPVMTLSDGTLANASEQVSILGKTQAAYFLAILIAQWFNVFVQKHRYRLPYGKDMLVNKMTYFGIFTSMVVAAIVAFIPALNQIFKTEIPPAIAIAPPIAAGIFLFIYEIIRRTLRNYGYFGGIPNVSVLEKPKFPLPLTESTPTPRSRELSIIGPPSLL